MDALGPELDSQIRFPAETTYLWASEMAQWVNALGCHSGPPELDPWELHGERNEPKPVPYPLAHTSMQHSVPCDIWLHTKRIYVWKEYAEHRGL